MAQWSERYILDDCLMSKDPWEDGYEEDVRNRRVFYLIAALAVAFMVFVVATHT
jgi:hypothetical protein